MSFPLAIDSAVIAALFRGQALTAYSTHFVALLTSNPTETGSAGTEVSTAGTGYARQAVSFSAPNRTASNAAAVEWPSASSSWGLVTHWGVYSAATGGTLIAYGALTQPKTVAQGDTVRIPISELTITLD